MKKLRGLYDSNAYHQLETKDEAQPALCDYAMGSN